jgi:hypothetical protein
MHKYKQFGLFLSLEWLFAAAQKRMKHIQESDEKTMFYLLGT